MAQLIFKNARVSINSVDLSDHVKECTLDYNAEMQDDTVMGRTSRSSVAGLLNWSATVTFVQDYAASKVDATLFPLVGAAAFPIAIRPVNDTISATNPEYQGNAVIENYQPAQGAVGDLLQTQVSFKAGGDLTRDVTP